MIVKDILRRTQTILYPSHGRLVDKTVADEFRKYLSPQARIVSGHIRKSEDVFHIFVADEYK